LSVGTTMNSSLDAVDVLDRIAAAVRKALALEWSVILLWDEQREAFRVAGGSSSDPSGIDDVRAMEIPLEATPLIQQVLDENYVEIAGAEARALDARPLGGEAAHRAEGGEDNRMNGALGAAREHGVSVAPADELGRRFRDLIDRSRDSGVINASVVGELAAASKSVEQRDPQPRFETPDMPAHHCMVYAQRLGSPAYPAQSSHRFERPQRCKGRHGPAIIERCLATCADQRQRARAFVGVTHRRALHLERIASPATDDPPRRRIGALAGRIGLMARYIPFAAACAARTNASLAR